MRIEDDNNHRVVAIVDDRFARRVQEAQAIVNIENNEPGTSVFQGPPQEASQLPERGGEIRGNNSICVSRNVNIAQDFILIDFLQAILDVQMRRGNHYLAWYQLLLTVLASGGAAGARAITSSSPSALMPCSPRRWG